MAVVKAAKVSSKKPDGRREIFATVCYYYPQYKLIEAQDLPSRDITLLLKTARKVESQKMYNLVQIAAAPHTVKGRGVKKLATFFSKGSK